MIIGILLMVCNYVLSKKYHYGGSGKYPTPKKVWASFKDAFWALLAPVIILGGIYGGIFTPTEAAVVGVVYGLIVGIFVYKELGRKEIYECFRDTMIVNGATTFIVGLSVTFANLFNVKNRDNNPAFLRFLELYN